MKLFDLVGDQVIIHADLLAIPPMTRIWEKYNKKNLANTYIRYIILKNHPGSPYVRSMETAAIPPKLKQALFNDANYVIPEDVLEAEKEWLALTDSLLLSLLRGTRARLERVARYQLTAEDDDLDDQKIDKIFASASKLGALAKSLETLETQVRNEELTSSKVRGGNEINPLEVPDARHNV